jgi:hypothetical protein
MLLAFGLLALGVFFLNRVNPPPSGDTTVYVLNVPDTDVQRMDVTTPAGTTAFERADPFGWKFASSGAPADLSRVSSVVNRVAKLRSSAKVADNVTDLKPYGLDAPFDTVTLTMKDGTQNKLLIGAKTVNDAAFYAMVAGRTELHTISTLLQGDVEKLVTDPPAPTPTPDVTTLAVITATPTPPVTIGTRTLTPIPVIGTPSVGTPGPTTVPTPTIGLPAPSVGQ